MIETKTATFGRIKIVDDDPNVRQGYEFSVTAADCRPVIESGPLGTLRDYLTRPRDADGAVSDYQLTPNNYANFDGAHLVSEWYKLGFPAILCTTFSKSNSAQFRALRRWLPVVISPEDLTPDSLLSGLEYANKEIHDDFSEYRRPWRALVHFVEYDKDTSSVSAKLPGWSSEAVSFRMVDLPVPLRDRVKSEGDVRCHAFANLGAQSNDELYVSNWEL